MGVIYLPERVTPQVQRLILLIGLATTVMVWPSLADPINFPKMFVLLLGTTWLLGIIIVSLVNAKSRKYSVAQWAYLIFGISILISAIATDVRYTAFIGANGRNNGALTYLAMGLLAFGATMSFKIADAKSIRITVLVLAGFLTFYGFLQSIKADPINWSVIYGPIIGTLGNPNFMSALLGTSAIAIIWFVMITKNRAWQSVAILGLFVALYVVDKSVSAQGLLAFGAGAALLVVAKLWQINRKVGTGAFLLAIVAAIPTFFGIFNKGPLASLVYQSSLENRLDYWYSAWHMFTSHIWLGVGFDRFMDYYGQYAPQVQVAQDQATNNAHNVFLQLLATGGLLVTIPYLLILGVILVTAFRGFFQAEGQAQIDIAAIFALWFSLLLISIISIDSLGVAVWFWILGGALYGVSRKQKLMAETESSGKGSRTAKNARVQSKEVVVESTSYFAPVLSLCLTILVGALLAPLWGTASAVHKLQNSFQAGVPTDGTGKDAFFAEAEAVTLRKPVTTQTLITVADLVLRLRAAAPGLKYGLQIVEKDPRSVDGHIILAYAYEISGEYAKAIPVREKLLEIEPWRTPSMVELIRDYLATKQIAKAEALAAHIQKLYPGSNNAIIAAQLIKG